MIRGENYQNKKQWDNAIADYAQAVALNPDFGMAYNDRCTALVATGKISDAILDCDKSIILEPTKGLYYSNRADAYGKLGKWDFAVADLQKALSLESDSSLKQMYQGELDKAKAALVAAH